MRRVALLTCILSLTASSALAETCVQPDGMAIGPIVPTAGAAREMYKTIARIRRDPIKPTSDILVNDKGDHWEVFQYPKDDSVRVVNGVVTVVAGGGTLDLEIKKCDASTVGHYDR